MVVPRRKTESVCFRHGVNTNLTVYDWFYLNLLLMNRGPGVCDRWYRSFKCETLILNDMKKEILHLVALAAVIMAIFFVGRYDYNEEIIYHMSDGTYEALRERLGDVSSTELVDVYMSDCEYWDSLGRLK